MSGDAHNVIYTNSNTTFLIQSVSAAGVISYNVVKGYENVPNYTNATVDYVNLDGDSYADYVYITGTPANAVYFGLVYVTDNKVQAALKADGGIDYYEIKGIVDGKEGTIKLDATATVSVNGVSTPVSTLTKADLEAKLTGYVNGMVVVKHVSDRVLGVWGPKTDVANLYTETNSNVAYTDLALDYQAASNTTGTITKNGNVLQVNGVYYNILNNLTSTTNGYAWAENEDLSGKNVYVVYDKEYKLNNTTYVAKEVYVADPASSGTSSGVTPAPTGTWAASGITGYEVNTTLSKVYVANANIKALGAVVDDWNAAGYVVTTTVGGVTSVVPTTATETVYSAILGGAKLTLSNATSSYTLVYEK